MYSADFGAIRRIYGRIEREQRAARQAILVGLSSPRLDRKENADEESLEELGALVETAGGVSVGVVLQTLPSPNPHTFIGEGKVDEIRELVKSQEATNGHLRQ